MTNCRFDVVLLVKVVALVYCCCAFTPARHSLNAGVSAATLYPRDGHVVQLWTNNFTSVIHQSTKLWIVNFYLSWCGHCQRFALQYKQFAQDVEAWNSVVGVAAVVCSDQVNAALCREYGANSFPALKLFPPNAPPSPHSVEVHGDKTRASLPLVVLQYLDTLVTAGNADSSWPKLNFVRRPGDILSDFSGTVFIVVEDNDSVARHIGQMVILDLLNWRETVRVGRMSLADAGSLAVTARGLYGLTSFSQLYPISVNGFHMQDLESSLYYSLWSEVPARATIENEALEALKRHINVMHKYLPAESHIVNFLRQTNNWLKSRTGSLSSTDWLNYITNSQNADAFVPSRLQWSGCQGSQPQFRGYPCSLWMTFHALTVNAYLREANNGDYTADEVIASIRGYVEHFLSCRDCADHFARAARSLLDVRNHTGAAATSVPYQQRRDGAVIWLWVAHNRANSRLRNDVTEDPIFPKVQFPGPELCPRCRLHDVTLSANGDSGNVAWNETAVLEFLTQFYGAPNIVDDDVHEEFSGNGLTQLMVSSACRSRSGLHVPALLTLALVVRSYIFASVSILTQKCFLNRLQL